MNLQGCLDQWTLLIHSLYFRESQVSPDIQDDQEHKVHQVQQVQQEFQEPMPLPDEQALKVPEEQLVQLAKLEQR